jgi:Ala-tRNA(Pro) deacylase
MVTVQESINLPTQPEAVFEIFDKLNIRYELHHHEAVFTVGESDDVDIAIGAYRTRNMFLRNKKKQNVLVTLSHDTPIDLKKLGEMTGFGRFSFGSPDRLMQYLGVYPGSVTPLSAMNASPDDMTVILEAKMMEAKTVAYHPLVNTMTVVITPDDLLKFLGYFGHKPHIMDLRTAAP